MVKSALASAALRTCFRSTSKALRCQQGERGAKCVAFGICPARRFIASTTSIPSIPTTTSSSAGKSRPAQLVRGFDRARGRGYSTKESSIQGTIGKGESGVADEIAREREVLEAPAHLNEKERGIWELLMRELACERLEVQDISGGCGSMYGIDVISERFRGLSMLKQQRLVNEVLGEEIKGWHGVQLKTRAP